MNLLSEQITNGRSTFSSIVIKSIDSTLIIAPDALIACAIAFAAAAPAAAPLVILGSLLINSFNHSKYIYTLELLHLFRQIVYTQLGHLINLGR